MKEKNTRHKKWKKRVIRLSLFIAIFSVVVIVFISPFTKYLIEKNDLKYLGREITMDWVYVNPFTGYIHFDDFKIYENKSDSVFFSADGITVNFAMLKLFTKTYEISSFAINNSKAKILKTKNKFNFSDILLKFSNQDTTENNKEPVRFNLLNVTLSNSELFYEELNSPIDYSFLRINFSSDGKYWNDDSVNGKLSLISGLGSGFLKANFLINTKSSDYTFEAVVQKFNLNIVKQYLVDLVGYGSLSGKLNANLKANGNLNSKQKVNGKGSVEINDFHFGKDSLNDFVSYEKLAVSFKQIAPAKKIFNIDTVKLVRPVFKYEKYDYLDNIQTMFGQNGSKIKAVENNPDEFNLIIIASNYIQTIFKNFFKSDYKINNLAIINANFTFNDFSLNEKFSASLYPLTIKADSVDVKKNLVNVYLNSGIKPYGLVSATLSIDPKTSKHFNLNYELRKIPVPLFNPYLVTYTSFPLNRGKIELVGNWQVRNDMIQSQNHLIIIDPRISERIRKKGARWLPLRFIMFFVRERGNVIDYEIPITGSLKNPNFNFKDAIIDAIKNIFIKPATTPYRFEVKNTEIKVEKSLSIAWQMRQTILNKEQKKFLKKISNFLHDNPKARITVHPTTFMEKEKEHILFYEAKKKYYLAWKKINQNLFTKNDSLAIEKMSSKDAAFIKFLDRKVNVHLVFTVQEKCNRLLGKSLVNREYGKMLALRNKVFMDFFEKEKTLKQVKMTSHKNEIPFKGFSYFEVNYVNDFPEYLTEANQDLNELNNRAPRAKYKKFRDREL